MTAAQEARRVNTARGEVALVLAIDEGEPRTYRLVPDLAALAAASAALGHPSVGDFDAMIRNPSPAVAVELVRHAAVSGGNPIEGDLGGLDYAALAPIMGAAVDLVLAAYGTAAHADGDDQSADDASAEGNGSAPTT